MACRGHRARWLVPALALLGVAVLPSVGAELLKYVEIQVFLNPSCSGSPAQVTVGQPQPPTEDRCDGLDVGEERLCMPWPTEAPQFWANLRCILADHSYWPAMALHTPMLKMSSFSGDECTPGDNLGILASYLPTDVCAGSDDLAVAMGRCNATHAYMALQCDDGCGVCTTYYDGPNDVCLGQSGVGVSLRFECSTCRTDAYTSELHHIGVVGGDPLDDVPSSLKDCYAIQQPAGTILGGYRVAHESSQVRAHERTACMRACVALLTRASAQFDPLPCLLVRMPVHGAVLLYAARHARQRRVRDGLRRLRRARVQLFLRRAGPHLPGLLHGL